MDTVRQANKWLRDMHGVQASEVSLVAAGGTGNRYRQPIEAKFDATLVCTPLEVLSRAQGSNVLAQVSDVRPAYIGTVGATQLDRGASGAGRFVDAGVSGGVDVDRG